MKINLTKGNFRSLEFFDHIIMISIFDWVKV